MVLIVSRHACVAARLRRSQDRRHPPPSAAILHSGLSQVKVSAVVGIDMVNSLARTHPWF